MGGVPTVGEVPVIKGRSILAIIPARGGSKRLPGKNIKYLGDKPLIAWTIEAAKGSQYVDRIIVSTDFDEIAKVATCCGADVPFKRPSYLATDEASSEDVIVHTFNWLEENNEGKLFDYFILLQPTSPFRTTSHIHEAIRQFIDNYKADAVVAVYENNLPASGVKPHCKDNLFNSVCNISGINEHSSYVINGALYICKTSVFLKDKSFYKRNCLPFIMGKKSSLDIDTKTDWLMAEKIKINTSQFQEKL